MKPSQLLGVFFFLATSTPACQGRPSSSSDVALGPEESEETRLQALKKLLEVFGMEGPPQPPPQVKQPPEFMVDLYNSVAGDDGVTKDYSVLEGNTVRSFFDKTHTETHLFFTLSSMAKNEKLLKAHLHLFKLRYHRSGRELGPIRHHFCQVKVYQVLDKDHPEAPDGKRFLSKRLVPIHNYGWEVLPVTPAVHAWMAEESSNQGLLVTVQALGGIPLSKNAVQFASGRDFHASKNPMLVVYTDDSQRQVMVPSNPFLDFSLPRVLPMAPNRTRKARSVANPPSLPCQRYPLSVDFEEIGWSSWIISPRSYNAYHCRGSCPFPLGGNMRPTNHATVQSIIHALKLSQEVNGPCCVPDQLYSINLLYFEDDDNVVLKQYNDMVAGSCGCH